MQHALNLATTTSTHTHTRTPASAPTQGMEDWDQATLESVVAQKHGAERPSNTTSIICKFFLDAVEKRQYGWFWRCPNGGDCKYRHALPPGEWSVAAVVCIAGWGVMYMGQSLPVCWDVMWEGRQ